MKSACEVGTKGWVVWTGLALSFHLLCRASEICAYVNGLLHADFLSDEERLGVFFGSVPTSVGRKMFCRQGRSVVPRFQVRLQEVGIDCRKGESIEREGQVLGRKEAWGVGDISGFTRPSPRTAKVGTIDADTHGHRVEGDHAHRCNKGLGADLKQFGERPDSVRSPLREDWGGNPACCARRIKHSDSKGG